MSDGADVASDTFELVVNPENSAPTISDIADQSVAEDGTLTGVSFTIGDLETAATAEVGTHELVVQTSANDTVTLSGFTAGAEPDSFVATVSDVGVDMQLENGNIATVFIDVFVTLRVEEEDLIPFA